MIINVISLALYGISTSYKFYTIRSVVKYTNFVSYMRNDKTCRHYFTIIKGLAMCSEQAKNEFENIRMNYLQELAKSNGINANIKSVDIIKGLNGKKFNGTEKENIVSDVLKGKNINKNNFFNNVDKYFKHQIPR